MCQAGCDRVLRAGPRLAQRTRWQMQPVLPGQLRSAEGYDMVTYLRLVPIVEYLHKPPSRQDLKGETWGVVQTLHLHQRQMKYTLCGQATHLMRLSSTDKQGPEPVAHPPFLQRARRSIVHRHTQPLSRTYSADGTAAVRSRWSWTHHARRSDRPLVLHRGKSPET